MVFKDFSLFGKHGRMMKELNSKFDEENQLFARMVDIYRIAPIVGFLYNRKADREKTSESKATIFISALQTCEDDIRFGRQMIALLNNKDEVSKEKRIDNAFRFFDTEKQDENEYLEYERYMLGGIEVLYEKLIEKSDNYIGNLFDFIYEMENRYNDICVEDIVQLAKKTK